ncbi:YdcH family protein [Roseomonas xinghualingensis]|uniref:YdcH family protein n=1 Tax=Roseomonas xinghualingensis TaxID=2986475 RepID=UPI003672EE63
MRMLNPHRLQSLKDRHSALDARITEETVRPMPDSLELARLKREKLRLKEEMERFEAQRLRPQ